MSCVYIYISFEAASWRCEAASWKDGQKCRSCQAFALTIEDLDYPNGMGSAENQVRNLFWVANIPGDWMAINETAVTELSEAVLSDRWRHVQYVAVYV